MMFSPAAIAGMTFRLYGLRPFSCLLLGSIHVGLQKN
jgi:hypothetical protein